MKRFFYSIFIPAFASTLIAFFLITFVNSVFAEGESTMESGKPMDFIVEGVVIEDTCQNPKIDTSPTKEGWRIGESKDGEYLVGNYLSRNGVFYEAGASFEDTSAKLAFFFDSKEKKEFQISESCILLRERTTWIRITGERLTATEKFFFIGKDHKSCIASGSANHLPCRIVKKYHGLKL